MTSIRSNGWFSQSRLRPAVLRQSPLFALVAVYLALGTSMRVVLWQQFGLVADVGPASLPYVLLAGLCNDIVESLYLFAPLAVYLLLMPDRWFRSRTSRLLMHVATGVTVAALTYLAMAEYFFFEEFDARFNIVAFDYLAYPTEVFTDIWDAYPVLRVLTLAAATGVTVSFLLRRAVAVGTSVAATLQTRLTAFVPHAFALALAVACYPTNALSISSNRVENELLQNGHSSFFRAARTSDIDYESYYSSRNVRANLNTLVRQLEPDGKGFTRLAEGRLDRRHGARADGLGRMNVVVVASESFGAEFSHLHGARKDWTPIFDSYARRGLWFSNTYASGTRTVRGLEALTASFPPIPTESILRRPGNHRIATWGRVMNSLGYDSSFIYGGYAYFDDMSTFYAGNGFEVIDRADIDRVRFANVWGVSDEDLFDRAIEHFGREHAAHRPFFSIVMTTSNHKPFTFRAGLEQLGIPPMGGGRHAGVRYADYALGYFLREAAKQPWFDDTLFVVVADHGARVYGKAEIPLQTYEIPLMIYAPRHLAPQRIDTLMTQIDVAPTVLGLLGLPYDAPFFGVDVLHAPPDESRVALFSHNHDVAIYQDGELVVFGLNKTQRTYQYNATRGTFTPTSTDARLASLGIAYFQTASDLFKAGRYN